MTDLDRFSQVGVALLGGFGDLNVDRSAKDGGGGDPSKAATSTALTLPPAELMKLRVPELKKKLAGAGVDLAKYPGAVEKKVSEEEEEEEEEGG